MADCDRSATKEQREQFMRADAWAKLERSRRGQSRPGMTATLSADREGAGEGTSSTLTSTPQHVLVSAMDLMSDEALYGTEIRSTFRCWRYSREVAVLAPRIPNSFCAASRPTSITRCGERR